MNTREREKHSKRDIERERMMAIIERETSKAKIDIEKERKNERERK